MCLSSPTPLAWALCRSNPPQMFAFGILLCSQRSIFTGDDISFSLDLPESRVFACRYPSFTDALRDLDDPLTMLHLFATLPAEAAHDIPAKAVQMSRRLALEWQSYVVRTHALRKVFVSVKGFYYQAEVLGQQVTWLVPHQLAQVICSTAGAGSM